MHKHTCAVFLTCGDVCVCVCARADTHTNTSRPFLSVPHTHMFSEYLLSLSRALVEACRSQKHAEREVDKNVDESIILSPLLCLGERLLVIHYAEKGSARMKRRKEREERDDEGMWSGKLQR